MRLQPYNFLYLERDPTYLAHLPYQGTHLSPSRTANINATTGTKSTLPSNAHLRRRHPHGCPLLRVPRHALHSAREILSQQYRAPRRAYHRAHEMSKNRPPDLFTYHNGGGDGSRGTIVSFIGVPIQPS